MSEPTIPNVCDTCHATDDREPICNRGSEAAPYYLCIDRAACTDRATAQQHEAAEKVRAAVEAEKAALEAGDVNAEPGGKHAATGPLKAITDAAVADMTTAAKASEDAPEDEGEASGD